MEAQEYKNEDIKEISNDDEEKLIMKTIEKIQNPEKQAKLLYLNKITNEREKIAENADKEQKDLIRKYNIKYSNIYNKINDIVFGKNNNLEITEEEKKKYNIDSSDSNTNDIKSYWKTVLENANYFMFDDEDKKILNYLNNIIYEETENGFKVSFIFDENEYFEPNILSKEYIYDNKNEISSIKATEINWKKEEFKNKKYIKQVKNKKDKKDKDKDKDKKDNKNKNNDMNVNLGLFSIFKSIDNINKKEKEEEKKGEINEELENELVIIDEEIDFFKNDLFKNQLEYYLNIMEIQEEGYDDEEYGEEEDYEDDYYNKDNENNNYYDNNNYNYRGRGYGRGQRRGRYNNYNNYNYNDYDNYDNYDDNYEDYGYRNNNNYYGNRGNNYYNNYRGGRGYGRGGRGGRGRYNYYQKDYY